MVRAVLEPPVGLSGRAVRHPTSLLPMFSKVLVANRGEIAIRAFRAAYEVGAKTVAVFPHEDRWSEHRRAMEAVLTLWLEVAADVARGRGIPLLLGEGYVGYTPRDGRFEEGPVGAELCRYAVREAARVDAWGAVVCSNAAPHHAMWDDVDLQRECAALLTGAG